jgi:putative flippase GtrA
MIEHIKFHGSKFFTKLFVRFIIGGSAGYVFTSIVTFILTQVIKLGSLVSYIIPFTLATIFNFIVAIKFIFKVNDRYKSRLVKYLISGILFYFLNILLYKFLFSFLESIFPIKTWLIQQAAIATATISIFLAKFLIYDHFVFHKHG